MHTYRHYSGLYVVGFWIAENEGTGWYPIREFPREYDAAAFVSFLNGGHGATGLEAARFTELRRSEKVEHEEA